ncbi:hypothetical protein TBLA_0H03670 [Henningerozyma blattae CBS 6284]|uniref:Mediator of RNA polymerase II transcription subunit 8 n=1 Tax=Henningerozyma blattae (strain ATCC 34711 / CBS 6284 / DSM 70876 / NBRC 10599 / NRRL Y-10934 / UCD 77-7) TaxID=1071380 RepID=I2H8E7_HENB6|nr:hypothetical protein TBLA_0H03670 [Tetrapisispora blattae CBS 6284]CCH62649.1 hypothetical protein TBLA_0H03670 [Tetrapisispora blattae CBS 6284]
MDDSAHVIAPHVTSAGIPTQALDAARLRLAQLAQSLRRLRDELAQPRPPAAHTLNAQLAVAQAQLASAAATLQHFRSTLRSAVAYPSSSFPTTSQEALLLALLRTKRTPEVDAALARAIDAGSDTTPHDDARDGRWAVQAVAAARALHDDEEEEDPRMAVPVRTRTTTSDRAAAEQVLGFCFSGV